MTAKEQRRQEEESSDYTPLRRGWCLGSAEFRQELLASAVERVGPNQYGCDRRETGDQKAELFVKE